MSSYSSKNSKAPSRGEGRIDPPPVVMPPVQGVPAPSSVGASASVAMPPVQGVPPPYSSVGDSVSVAGQSYQAPSASAPPMVSANPQANQQAFAQPPVVQVPVAQAPPQYVMGDGRPQYLTSGRG